MSYFTGHVPKDIIVKISRVEYIYILQYVQIEMAKKKFEQKQLWI